MDRLTREALDKLFVWNMGNSLPGSHSVHAALVELRKIRFLMEQYNIPDLSAIETLLKANAEGRAVVLPEFGGEDYNGLKVKYRVFKARNYEPVEDCFVLRPAKDKAARGALLTYANYTDNAELSADLREWLERVVRQEAEAAIEKEKTNG